MRRIYTDKEFYEIVQEAIKGHDIEPKDVRASGIITSPSITETMSGYYFETIDSQFETIFGGVTKTGNKITFVLYSKIKGSDAVTNNTLLALFKIPESVGVNLIPSPIGALTNVLDVKVINLFEDIYGGTKTIKMYTQKDSDTQLKIGQYGVVSASLDADKTYVCRYEVTFLLGGLN